MKILKDFATWLPWQPEFCSDSSSLNNFQLVPPKDNSCEVWSKLVQWFRRSQLLTDDGQQMTDPGVLAYLKSFLSTMFSGDTEHYVLRWAKNLIYPIKSRGQLLISNTKLISKRGLTDHRLNELPHTIYWKILIYILRLCDLDIPREKWLTICKQCRPWSDVRYFFFFFTANCVNFSLKQ